VSALKKRHPIPTRGVTSGANDYANEALAALQSSRDKRGEIAEAFAPIAMTPLERPHSVVAPSPCWIVTSDHHWPRQDERVESVILRVIEELKPRGYILDGDGPDLLAMSKYPKDARPGKAWHLRDEQRAAKSWWREIGRLGQGWGMALYETEANHSGNGTASRWTRWLNENCPLLWELDGAEDMLDYRRYFHHADVPVALVDEVVICSDLRVRHGEMARKHGGYSARARRQMAVVGDARAHAPDRVEHQAPPGDSRRPA
jgi:hypothetical protein